MKISSHFCGLLAGWALLAGSGSLAFGQFAMPAAPMAMPTPVCVSCAPAVSAACVPSVSLAVPTLSQSALQPSLSVPTLVVPPPPPPAGEVRAYPVVRDDRDRDREFEQKVAPVELDASRTEPASYASEAAAS